MADIMLTCPHCGKQTSVSEYITEKMVACHACRQALSIPEQPKSSGGRLKLRKLADKSTLTTIPTWPTTGAGNGIPVAAMGQQSKPSATLTRDIRRVRLNRFLQSLSWLVFVVLTAVLIFIRFRHGLPAVPPDTIKQWGLIAIGISYLAAIILAVRDNMFDGLLSIVVPFYPFYYLFFISNIVFLRAIVAALLVAFGLDLGVFLQIVWLQMYNKVNYWIQHA